MMPRCELPHWSNDWLFAGVLSKRHRSVLSTARSSQTENHARAPIRTTSRVAPKGSSTSPRQEKKRRSRVGWMRGGGGAVSSHDDTVSQDDAVSDNASSSAFDSANCIE